MNETNTGDDSQLDLPTSSDRERGEPTPPKGGGDADDRLGKLLERFERLEARLGGGKEREEGDDRGRNAPEQGKKRERKPLPSADDLVKSIYDFDQESMKKSIGQLIEALAERDADLSALDDVQLTRAQVSELLKRTDTAAVRTIHRDINRLVQKYGLEAKYGRSKSDSASSDTKRKNRERLYQLAQNALGDSDDENRELADELEAILKVEAGRDDAPAKARSLRFADAAPGTASKGGAPAGPNRSATARRATEVLKRLQSA